jgi:hypothetical protein
MKTRWKVMGGLAVVVLLLAAAFAAWTMMMRIGIGG